MVARSETEIFESLRELCGSPGFVHAIAYFSFRDNLIRYGKTLDAEAMESQHAPERLVRTEIATLNGLLIQHPVDEVVPEPEMLQAYIDRAQALLQELHHALMEPWKDAFTIKEGVLTSTGGIWAGAHLREPIFYSGESDYGFQYRALAIERYRGDNAWLLTNKGFEIEDAVAVAEMASPLLSERQVSLMKSMRGTKSGELTMLSGFLLTAQELNARLGTSLDRIQAVLDAFTLPDGEMNPTFIGLNDFNVANAMPLIRWSGGRYLLLQHYSLLESIYESPTFWMMKDRDYLSTAIKRRGAFTETFVATCLERIFTPQRVFRNIDIYRPNGNRLGEIDVLAVFGRHAILVQAKSKRLTIEARKGNDLQIKDDFKKAVQDAADQGFECAEALLDSSFKLKTAEGETIELPRDFEVIQPFCVVSDHYPSLAIQVREFLNARSSHRIAEPVVVDVFALDVLAEMLSTPLHFLHYLTLRTRFGHKVSAGHELTLLGYHLARNFWFDDEDTLVMLTDDIAMHLDIAMLVRREGLPGKRTPDGILTRLKNTTFGALIDQIDESDDAESIDIGLELLQLGEETARALTAGIDKMAAAARADRRPHDLSLALGESDSGLTIHCRYGQDQDAVDRLINHCNVRKYHAHADSWYGVILDPDTKKIVISVGSRTPWVFDPEMAQALIKRPPPPPTPWSAINSVGTARMGRNATCPCGSGKKFKKCCLTN